MVVAALFLALVSSPQAFGAKVSLTPKEAAERTLVNSPDAKAVQLNYQSKDLDPLDKERVLDWKFLAQTKYTFDKNESFSVMDEKTELYDSSLDLKKTFITGTIADLTYYRKSRKLDVDLGAPTSTQTIYPSLTNDYLGFQLEQPLWGDSFGYGTRSLINSAETNLKAEKLKRADDLQELVLTGLRQYWKTVVANQNLHESISSRDRAQKLADTVRRKSSYGYSNPGELYQALADLETKNQSIKSASLTYLQETAALAALLDYPEDTEFDFVVPNDVPPVPKLPDVKIEDSRKMRSQVLTVESKDQLLTSAKSDGQPRLNLLAGVSTTGLDESPTKSASEMWTGTQPQYYVGMKFEYSFGSGYYSENVRNKRIQKEIESVKLQQLQVKLRDDKSQAVRKVQANYEIVSTQRKVREYREKAMKDLQRSYNQGRTSIKDLIDAMNFYSQAEVQLANSLGDYQIALNEWAALRDELIPEQKEPSP